MLFSSVSLRRASSISSIGSGPPVKSQTSTKPLVLLLWVMQQNLSPVMYRTRPCSIQSQLWYSMGWIPSGGIDGTGHAEDTSGVLTPESSNPDYRIGSGRRFTGKRSNLPGTVETASGGRSRSDAGPCLGSVGTVTWDTDLRAPTMARIVYGISGEGSGHSSRAREMMAHLLASGHEVKAVSYDRGYRNLKDDFDVFETEGLHIASEDNRVSIVKTFTDNLSRLSDGVRRRRELRRSLFKEFRPDCVITDFEPMTAYLALRHDLPLITIDNQHRMRYMRYPCPRSLKKDSLVTETVIRALVPRPDVSLVTTFYFGEVTNERTFLFPPILRREVLDLEPTEGDHVLVYFTQGFEDFLAHLEGFPRERFLVYGSGREGEEGHLTYKGFSADGFLEDLASCKAVVATAGFTLMTESLHLGKPYLALPMRGQFEQSLNAILLGEAGYGKNGWRARSVDVGDFLYRLPEYRERLATYPAQDNRVIKAKLDELLADGCALAHEYHRRRRDGGGTTETPS